MFDSSLITVAFNSFAQASLIGHAQNVHIKMSFEELFEKLKGRTCRTWFEPGKLAEESMVTGEISGVLDGRFLRHRYQGMIQGKVRRGEELIAYHAITKLYQIIWVDDFHMNYAILFSPGQATERGFSVRGEYDVSEDQL